MNGKVVVATLVGIAILVLVIPVQLVQAGIEPVLAVDHIYAALNSGDLDPAMALFAKDATAKNLIRKETYSGENEIRQMFEGRQREGRRYEIVKISMDRGTITAKVEISDRGFVWGTETIEAVVKDGRLQTFVLKEIRLEFDRFRQ